MITKRLLLNFVFIMFLNTLYTYSQCQGIKKGTFISDDKLAGRTTIQRLDSIQLEENEVLGTRLFGRIKWTNKCSYILYNLKVLKNENEIPISPGNYLVSIEQLNDTIFNQTVLIEKENFTYKSIIIKTSNDIVEDIKKYLKIN